MHPILRSKFTTIVLACCAVWLGILTVAAGARRYAVRAELNTLESRIDDSYRENERLARELERMKKPGWLALIARQRLNFKQPDETVVFVYKSEKSDTISQPQTSIMDVRPNWRKWLDWFRGK